MPAVQQELLARAELERRVREKMRDYPELNTLIANEESSTSQIQGAIDVASSMAYETPPPVGWPGLHKFPLYLILPMVVAELLESAALLYIRNDVSFSTGGSTVQFDQGRTYLQMASQMRESAKADLVRWKVALNHQQAVDSISGVHSEWLWINTRPIAWYAGAVFTSRDW